MKTTPEQLRRLVNEQHAVISRLRQALDAEVECSSTLREENARLREALKPFLINHPAGVDANDYDWLLVKPDDIRRAQAVIREGEEK